MPEKRRGDLVLTGATTTKGQACPAGVTDRSASSGVRMRPRELVVLLNNRTGRVRLGSGAVSLGRLRSEIDAMLSTSQ